MPSIMPPMWMYHAGKEPQIFEGLNKDRFAKLQVEGWRESPAEASAVITDPKEQAEEFSRQWNAKP